MQQPGPAVPQPSPSLHGEPGVAQGTHPPPSDGGGGGGGASLGPESPHGSLKQNQLDLQ